MYHRSHAKNDRKAAEAAAVRGNVEGPASADPLRPAQIQTVDVALVTSSSPDEEGRHGVPVNQADIVQHQPEGQMFLNHTATVATGTMQSSFLPTGTSVLASASTVTSDNTR